MSKRSGHVDESRDEVDDAEAVDEAGEDVILFGFILVVDLCDGGVGERSVEYL